MRTEIVAGLTTFFAMVCILVVNPQVLAAPFVLRGRHGVCFADSQRRFFCDMSDRFSGNVFDGRLRQSTVCAGTGYGTDCLFRVYRSSGKEYCCQEALALVSGLLFIFITAIRFRKACIRAIPQPVKSVMSADIGLFLALIGLENASVVVSNGATFISMIDFSLWNHAGDAAGMVMAGGMKYPVADYHRMIASAIVALAGLVVTDVLFARRVKGSIFIGILVSPLLGIPFGLTALHDFSFNLAGQAQDFWQVSFSSWIFPDCSEMHPVRLKWS